MLHPIETVEAFRTYALAIESEAAQRYREFTRYFTQRDEPVLAALCDTLARMESGHEARLSRAAEAIASCAPEGAYPAEEADKTRESGPREAFYRLLHPEQLLAIALEGEIRARRFFDWAARTSTDPAVRTLAAQLAREEAHHIRLISDALASHKPLGPDADQRDPVYGSRSLPP